VQGRPGRSGSLPGTCAAPGDSQRTRRTSRPPGCTGSRKYAPCTRSERPPPERPPRGRPGGGASRRAPPQGHKVPRTQRQLQRWG